MTTSLPAQIAHRPTSTLFLTASFIEKLFVQTALLALNLLTSIFRPDFSEASGLCMLWPFGSHSHLRPRETTVLLENTYCSIKRYVSSRDSCLRRKTPSTRPAGQPHPLAPLHHPFLNAGVDLVGRFSDSFTGNRGVTVAANNA